MKVAALACGFVAAATITGCSSSNQESAGTTTSTAPTASPSTTGTLAPLPSPPGSYPVLSAQDPAANVKAIAEATAESKSLVEQLRQQVTLNDVEAACVIVRLDAYPALKEALGTNAQTSPRLPDLTRIATDCMQATSGALNWANGVQEQTNGTLTPEQLTCLRDGYAGLSRESLQAIAQAGLDPSKGDPITANLITGILSKCGIDPAKVPQPR